jgi:CubicO group peptidase (beta-lactamase class C family)
MNNSERLFNDRQNRSASTPLVRSLSNTLKQFSILILTAVWIVSLGACGGSALDDSRPSEKDRVEVAGMRLDLIEQAAQYAGGAGIVTRGDKTIYRWGDQTKRYDLKSTTKSFGSIALGLAVKDGLVDLNAPVVEQFPELGIPPEINGAAGWVDDITYLHLATHTAGFDKPGGYEPLLYKPGSSWAYSDGGANWLADTLTHLYRRDLKEILFERVFGPLGITAKDLTWRENHYRESRLNGIPRREFGSGISANVAALAKIGLLFLRGGQWHEKQILPRAYVELVRRPISSLSNLTVENDPQHRFAGAPRHYGLLWWNNGDGAIENVPTDAFWSWGLYDSLIVVIPSLDIVVARAGETIVGERSPSDYLVLGPFFRSIVASVNNGAPYPNSPVIANIIWDGAASIIRKASGGDNWPLTWANDDRLYTAYGDGSGFEPQLDIKLSLGFARVEGNPPNFTAENIRSSGEQRGNGQAGKKASGMLMVNGVLYMWVRNANQSGEGSQLAWSFDLGKTWHWNKWLFDWFGYCTFVNFGRNYEDARDGYIYTVSHDASSAYKRADCFVLMRVPYEKVLDRKAYEFFKDVDQNERPVWTKNIEERGAVFKDTGRCYRSGISFNPYLRRYIWWQAKFAEGINGRLESKSFGVFDAPEPWGPWTTVYYTEKWDVTTGETGSFPPKWMSEDGKTMHLVFSGNDSFSVRKATLSLFLQEVR